MGEWKTVDLAEVSDDISYGYTASAAEDAVGPKFLRITDIVDGTVNWATVPYCLINEKDMAKYRLVEGDIVIARTGATTGANYTIRSSDPKDVVFASYLIRYRIDRTKALPRYVGYCLRSSLWNSFVEGVSGGSAQPGANAKVLGSFAFDLPDLPEQRAIASVLSSLDAKIDLLHRQNKTLEAMAEALFRQWFVEEAEEGWEEGTLGDIITVQGGTTPSTQNPAFWDGEYCWTTPRDLSGDESLFLFNTARKITAEGLKQIGSGLLPVGTLLLSSRAPVGYTAFAAVPVAINQGYIAINANEGYSNYFIYLWLKANMETVKGHANGSTFQEISKSAFKTIEITIPPSDRVEAFDKVVAPLFDKVKSNQVQTQSLTKLRDTLLPKLMSGEVRVEMNEVVQN
ncbi:MAG: restriction endonuclease subunit S [Bacteroidetes bacterium]|nr:restriction endonuclease subunit S [Bacteroidota bacterium]